MTTASSKLVLVLVLTVGLLGGIATIAGAGRNEPPPATPEVEQPATEKADRQERTYLGQVVDPDGSPVAGAVIHRQGRCVATSDKRGEFRYTTALPSPARRSAIPLVATADGFAAAWTELGEQPKLTLRLVRSRTARGRLVDLEGQPIRGAKLHLTHVEKLTRGDWKQFGDAFRTDVQHAMQLLGDHLPSPRMAGLPDTVTTDVDGRFEIACVGSGWVLRWEVEAKGFERIVLRSVVDGSFDAKMVAVEPRPAMPGMLRMGIPTIHDANFTHALRPTQAIVGTVRDATIGKPLAGAKIRILFNERSANALAQSRWPVANLPATDADGRFHFDVLPPGLTISFSFQSAGRYLEIDGQFRELSVEPGQQRDLGEVKGKPLMLP